MLTLGGQPLLASCESEHAIRIWNPATHSEEAELLGHTGSVLAVTSFDFDGQQLLASGGTDGTVRLWSPARHDALAVLEGHADRVSTLSSLQVHGRTLIVSGADDRTLRLWDPATGMCVLTIPVHHPPQAVINLNGLVLVGSDRGLLALEIDPLIAMAANGDQLPR